MLIWVSALKNHEGSPVRKSCSLFGLAVLALCFSFLVIKGYSYLDITVIPVGEANVDVYVVALDGVGGYGVNDVSRVVEGVIDACQVNSSRYYTGNTNPYTGEVYGPPSIVFVEIKINTTVTVVTAWDTYKHLVESGSNIIIVNAHGETVPVPLGYTKEGWVDEIAEAMLQRNVTWVHTAGYPFYYYYLQGVGNGTWGEAGFQRLMSHIDLGNVTCHPKYAETDKIPMNTHAEDLSWGWGLLGNAIQVEHGRPLNCSDFKDYIVLPIWGTDYGYATGAVVRFSVSNQSNPGIYVHIGTNQTFNSVDRPTEADYMRGYAGAAAAIWSSSHRVVSEKKCVDAEKAIVEAETEGRTKGLDIARQLLDDARQYYQLGKFMNAVERARYAQETANRSVRPSFTEAYGTYLAATLIAGVVVIASGLTVRWERNRKKEEGQK